MKARKLGQNLASVGGGAGHGEVSKNGGELERERKREREIVMVVVFDEIDKEDQRPFIKLMKYMYE